jgi:hypothetical protein
MKIILLTIAFFFAFSNHLDATDFTWVKKFGSLKHETVNSISLDGNGNVYVAGIYRDTAYFQNQKIYCNQDQISCGFIVKYNNYGDVLWIKDFAPNVLVSEIHVSDQSMFVSGFFKGTVTFGNQTLTAIDPGSNFFFLKMDLQGNIEWVKHGTSQQKTVLNANKIFSDNNFVFLAGIFSLDLQFEGDSITGSSNLNNFLIKLDKNGLKKWINHFKVTSIVSRIEGLVIDINNNIYISGDFYDGLKINNDSVISNGSSDVYIAKLTSGGDLVWLKNYGGKGQDESAHLGIDSLGTLYISGSFRSDTFFVSQQYVTNSGAFEDIFVAKVDPSGEAVWLQKAGGNSQDQCSTAFTDNSGNTYIAGHYTWTMEIGDTVLNSIDVSDFYAAKFNSDGNLVWVHSAGSRVGDRGRKIVADQIGNAYVAGSFSENPFGGDSLEIGFFGLHQLLPFKATGSSFIARIGSPLTSVKKSSSQLNIKVYPTFVQSENLINIEYSSFSGEDINIQVFDIYGKEHYKEKFRSNKFAFSSGNMAKGTYILYISTGSNQSVHKFIVF